MEVQSFVSFVFFLVWMMMKLQFKLQGSICCHDFAKLGIKFWNTHHSWYLFASEKNFKNLQKVQTSSRWNIRSSSFRISALLVSKLIWTKKISLFFATNSCKLSYTPPSPKTLYCKIGKNIPNISKISKFTLQKTTPKLFCQKKGEKKHCMWFL